MIDCLKSRFEANPHRHPNLTWADIESKLTPDVLRTLELLETTGGEPDVVLLVGQPNFVDCSLQSPKGRRSLCYDDDALESRKEAKPKGSALGLAQKWQVELLTESDYLELQTLEDFDTTTSSWLVTPSDIRMKGGAIFGDKRFGRSFIYHNGAESYYAARGFRVKLPL